MRPRYGQKYSIAFYANLEERGIAFVNALIWPAMSNPPAGPSAEIEFVTCLEGGGDVTDDLQDAEIAELERLAVEQWQNDMEARAFGGE